MFMIFSGLDTDTGTAELQLTDWCTTLITACPIIHEDRRDSVSAADPDTDPAAGAAGVTVEGTGGGSTPLMTACAALT